MESFSVLEMNECIEIDAGGVAAAVAGAMAGAMIGTFASLIPAVVAQDPSIVGHGAILGASIGTWVGAGAPLP